MTFRKIQTTNLVSTDTAFADPLLVLNKDGTVTTDVGFLGRTGADTYTGLVRDSDTSKYILIDSIDFSNQSANDIDAADATLTKATLEIGTLDTENFALSSTDAGSSAGPEFILYRDSASPTSGDYIGQIQFKGKNSNGGDEIYAKVTGKISDSTLGSEDGLIETAIKGNGSFTIVSRQRSDELQLINGTGLDVAGNVTIGGTTTVGGNILPDTTETYDIGSSTVRFNDIYLAGSTVDIGGTKISKDSNGDIDIKDSSNNRKTIRARAIELVDSQGKKMKLERGNNGKMKTTKMDENGNEEGDQQAIEIENDTSPKLGGNLDGQTFNITTTGKILFANMYSNIGDLPSATTYHGMFAHVHATGKGYFAHGGSWVELANQSDIPTVPTNVSDFTNDAGYVTTSYADSNVDSHINVSGASGGQVLSWTGSDYEWVTRGTSNSDTTYTAGSGLSLNGTTFSVTGDQRGNISQIGADTNDYITVGTTTIDFRLDGNLDMRLENDGDLHVDGNVVAYSTTTSDPRLKENIKPVENALEKLEKLTGYTFDYKKDGKASAGVLSTEVEKVLPSAVQKTTLPLQADDDTEYDVVEYDQLTAILIEAVKQLSAKVKELENANTR